MSHHSIARFILSKADYIVIALGIVMLFLVICLPACNLLNVIAVLLLSCVGCFYLYNVLSPLFFYRIDFDWRLMNGHFLRKLTCLIVLLPFMLTLLLVVVKTIAGIFNYDAGISPQELIYDSNLYSVSDSITVNVRSRQQSPTILWSVYSHFMDPGNQHMATSVAGRAWAALFAILGVFLLNGLLISILTNWFDKRREHWLRGELRYPRWCFRENGYAVIIGANEIVSSVIKNLLNRNGVNDINFKCEGHNDYIILQTSREAIEVREELSSHLTEGELRRLVIYNARRDSRAELEKLYLENATEIYVLGESTIQDAGEACHDALNMKCVNLIAECLESNGRGSKVLRKSEIHRHKKVCKVMFEYQTTYSIFQFSDLSEKVNNNIVFIPFNRYEAWAQRVMVEGVFENRESFPGIIEYTPLDGAGIAPDSDKYVHFVVVGMSKMGIAMGVQAILQAHYLNFKKKRSRISFIDTNADAEMAFFRGRYQTLLQLTRYKYVDANNCTPMELESERGWIDPAECEDYKWSHLSKDGRNFIDIEIEFIKGKIESEGVRSYLCQLTKDKYSKLTIAVCLTQTHQAVAASLYMPLEIYKKVQEIWVYQREASDIITNLTEAVQKNRRYIKLRPFGMMYAEYMRDRSLYLKALLANGAYNGHVRYKKAMKDGKTVLVERNMKDKSTYDDLRGQWKKLTIANKWSNKFFVDTIYQKIRGIAPEVFANCSVAGSYKDKLLAVSADIDIEKVIRKALNKHEEVLAMNEHNRWNVQQLLMEFRPCEKEIDEEFCRLNQDYKYKKELADNCDSKCDAHVQLLRIANEAKERFGKEKERVKASAEKIHPNICAYSHLDEIDFGAKQFDKNLNSAILEIIILVDGYGKVALK